MRERCPICGARERYRAGVFCDRHGEQWEASLECVRGAHARGAEDSAAALADFVRRIQAEERNGRHGS